MTVKSAFTHKRAMRKTLTPYLLLAPVIIFICCFMFWPIINVFILSMQNHVVTKPKNWGYTGFSHYVKIFTKDAVFTKSLFTTLRWVVVSVAFQCVLGFWLAYVLNKKFALRGISRALAADYFCIYYVDTDTGRFIEYSSDEHYRTLGIEKSGEDFFGLCRKNIPRVVHPDDAELFLSLFTKDPSRSDGPDEWGNYREITGRAEKLRPVERELKVDGIYYPLDRVDGIRMTGQ